MKKTVHRPLLPAVLLLLTAACAAGGPGRREGPPAAPSSSGRVLREPIEWCNLWITGAGKEDLPRVLFIGDSITQGYFGEAARAFSGKAFPGRLTTSFSVCDPVFLDLLRPVLHTWRFAVVQFNNGIHGDGYAIDEYKQGLERAFRFLREEGRGAKIVWASSTPARDARENAERNARIRERNAAALELCGKYSIPVNDLYGLMKDKDSLHRDMFHYKKEALRIQGKAAARFLLPFLEARKN